MQPPVEGTIRIGASACLLGHAVRYDGGHRRSRSVAEDLAARFELVPVCPEVEAGLGTPRPAMRLIRAGGLLRVREVATLRDHTEALEAHARSRVAELGRLDLSGYVFKSGSPSCGIARVKVFREAAPGPDEEDAPGPDEEETGQGVFAAALQAALPLLPVAEEGDLDDPRRLEEFVERVVAHWRQRQAARRGR